MSDVLVSRKGKKVYHENFCPYILRTERKNRKTIDELEAIRYHYRECSFCRSVRGLVYKYRKSGLDTSFDPIDNAMCIRTEVGFWKAIWVDEEQKWKLFHCNHGDFAPEKPSRLLMRGHFHRQRDVPLTSSLSKIVAYILRHDESLIKCEGDYRKMPKNTPKQRKYYNRAKNRAKKKSIRNVYKILDQIKMEENGKENQGNG